MLWALIPKGAPNVKGDEPRNSPGKRATVVSEAIQMSTATAGIGATVDVNGTAQALAATYAAATAEVEATMDAETESRLQSTMIAVVATATFAAEQERKNIAATAQADKEIILQATADALARATATHEAWQEATREAQAQATRIVAATATANASGPPSCGIPVGAPFLSLWRESSVYSMLGCPTGPAHQSMSAEEQFECGFMLWRDSSDSVYVLFDDETWTISQDHFVDGRDPEYSCGVPQSPPSPRRGFSKVWCYHPGVKEKIGNAIERESGYGMAGGGPAEIFQDFEGGMMYQSNHFHTVYALFENGTWQK
jgi:hypothetical protein